MRYTGPRCKQCRREGQQLFLKGERCRSDKCSALKKSYPPGQHGKVFRKLSEYGRQLREKQKLKRIYDITERLMQRYYKKAVNMAGDTSENLLRILNLRLDNILYLSGLVTSRPEARQMINHGFFKLNKKKATISSMQTKKGDKVTIKSADKSQNKFQHLEEKKKSKSFVPRWLKVDQKNLTVELIDLPEAKELKTNIDPQLIIGFYSR